MGLREPCLCGAEDCPECYPGSWRETKNIAAWENEDSKQSYEDWHDDKQSEKEEYELQQAEDLAEQRREDYFI